MNKEVRHIALKIKIDDQPRRGDILVARVLTRGNEMMDYFRAL